MSEEALGRRIIKARARLGADDRDKELTDGETRVLDRLEEEHGQIKWRLEQQYPGEGKAFRNVLRPEKGARTTSRTGSLLRIEVKPEDVVVTKEVVTSATGDGWEEWGEGYKSLEEEIEENEEERKAAGLEFGPTVSMDAWAAAGWDEPSPEDQTPINDHGLEGEVADESDHEDQETTYRAPSDPNSIGTSQPVDVQDLGLRSGTGCRGGDVIK